MSRTLPEVLDALTTAFGGQEHDLWDAHGFNAAQTRHDRLRQIRDQGVANLTGDDLDWLVCKSMTTVGGVPTLKFFLPRFLTMALSDAAGDWIAGPEIILARLDTAGFDGWPKAQRAAILEALAAWTEREEGDAWVAAGEWVRLRR